MVNSSLSTTAHLGALPLEDTLRRWVHRVAAAHLSVAPRKLPIHTPSGTVEHQHGTPRRARRTLTPTTVVRPLHGMHHPEPPTRTRTVERRLLGAHPPEHRIRMLRVAPVVAAVVDGAAPHQGGTKLGGVQLPEGQRGVTTLILGVAGCVTSFTLIFRHSYRHEFFDSQNSAPTPAAQTPGFGMGQTPADSAPTPGAMQTPAAVWGSGGGYSSAATPGVSSGYPQTPGPSSDDPAGMCSVFYRGIVSDLHSRCSSVTGEGLALR